MSLRTNGSRSVSAVLLLAAAAAMATAQADPGAQAFALEQQGRIVEAESAWEALARQHPRSPDPLAHLGLLEARQEHYAKAIDYYKRAMVLNPAMPGLRLNLGLAYFKSGDYQQTIPTLAPLLKAQPDDQRLDILVGMSHYGLGQFAAASPFLKQASDRDPQNLNLLLTLAHSCLLSKQYPCVVDAYHKIISLDAESAEADMLVGEALDEMKDTEGAIREFRAAEAANPKEPNVHFGLGYLLWTKNEYTEAAKEFQAEVDNDPQHFQAMLYLADSDLQNNDLDNARILLEKLEKINTNSSKEHLDLGIVLADQGKNQAALAEFEKAAKLAPNDVNVRWRMARLYRTMGRTAEAKIEFDKAKTLNQAADEKLLNIMSTIPTSKPSAPADGSNPANQ
ncbi:MAG TPA: tetratricopeptide repeat protein [Terracidiphilus sp.]|jgi:tetratricopeptide (TPR) repeat protein|nr:tetratricopeptide repeat protein [Terracidiphilus sp.]